MFERCGVQERLTIKIYDTNGNLVETREPYTGSWIQKVKRFLGLSKCTNDIVLNAGLADVAEMISNRYGYIEVGTNATAPATTDTGCLSPTMSRSAVTATITTTFYTDDTVRFAATFTPEFTTTVYEAALCKDASSGEGDVVFARETFPGFTAVGGTTFTATWDVVVMR